MKTKQCHHFIVLIGLLIGCLLPAKVSASPSVLVTGQWGDNVTYTIYSDMSMVISGTGSMWDDNSIPSNYMSSIESVTIEEGVTTIGKRAFWSFSNLTSVTIPSSITDIGRFAFENCTSLNSVTIPYGVTTIDAWAFSKCYSLSSVTIPNSVTTIAVEVFGNCTNLTSVTIPSSVTIVAGSVFSGCTALSSIIVDAGNATFDSRNNCNAIIETSTNKLIVGCKNTVIPSSVTSIGEDAFYYCSALTSVTIPNSVTEIGWNAFMGCSGLTSVTIPSSVTDISGGAFTNCTGLTSITCESETPVGLYQDVFDGVNKLSCTLYVPTGSKSAYENAEYWNLFTHIEELTLNVDGIYYNVSPSTMTASVTKKPSGYYSGDITIPETVSLDDKTYRVTEIEELAFYDCKSLTSVTIPNGVTSIGYRAFWGCAGLTSVIIPNGVTSIGRMAFCGCTGLTSVTIPNSVTSIGVCAFSDCTGLTSVTIPNSVTSIEECAFDGCTGLTSVAIPNSVTSIDYGAFRGCAGLTSVTIPNGVTSIGERAFSSCTGLSSVTIPNSVTSIGSMAFLYCTGLTTISVDAGNSIFDSRNDCNAIIETSTNELILGCKNTVIPNSVTSIGEYAFSGCKGLTSVTIPNSVTSIGSCAFSSCTGLSSVTIPNGVTSIEEIAFSSCTGLTSVTIPNSVTSIGDFAFSNCTSLTSISCQNETPVTITNSVFSGVNKSTCTLYVPTGSKSAYQSAWVWREFTNIEELTLNVDGIYYNISPSTMTASVTKKPSGYYSGDIIIQETVSLDDKTYRVTEIEELAFYDCKSLTSVTIPNGVTSIGRHAFYNCTRLTSIDIPSSVTSIGWGAFSNCTGLTSVTIPNGVTTIEPETFNMCNSLASVIIPNGVTSVGSMAFCRCFDLTSVTIPNGVTSIGNEAFLYCTGLTSVTIPNSVTSISNEAFSNCTSLTSFTCQNETPVTITNSVFSGVNKSICTLNVPTGSKSAYQSAAVWSEFTNIVEFIPVVVTGQCGDNVSWSFDTNTGELTISGTGPMWDYDWTRPLMDDEYNGSITSVTVEEGVTSIGDYAFYENPNLTSITIPNSVTRIGSGTFCECTGLTSFTIPNSVTNIDNDAFLGTTWYNNQPDGLVYINNVAYKYKGTMPEGASIAIRNGTVSISECAFSSCTGLTSVTIPNSVTIISRYAFSDCTNLTSITCESQTPVSISSNNVFHNVDRSACTLYVPAGSMTAYQSAAVWSEFTNIVEFIPVVATGQCGDNLTYTIYDDMSMVISGTGPMWDYVAEDTHPNQDYYSDVKSVTIEEGCTYVGKYAFDLMGSLTDVTIPGSVIEIGTGAFSYCRQLSSLELSAGLKIIGGGAFECCGRQDSGLKSITIPSTVTTIGGAAFTSCYLNSITVESSSPLTIQANTFASTDVNSCTLYVPTGSKSAYQSADVWKDFTNIVEYEGSSPSVLATGPCGDNLTYTIYDDMSMVITGTGPMWDYSSDTPMNSDYKGSVTSVTIEEGSTAIGKYAFYGCAGLTSVDIPNSVTSIGENAFWCCTGLTSVDIPNSVTSIGWNSFANTGLTTVTIPSSVSYISPATFTYCSGLIFINVEAGNATYDSRENCNAIIEKSTNTLIAGCNNTVIPNSVTSIDIYALAGCTGLTSIDIPNSVTSIGEDAFESCTGLTSVDIPNSVTSIGNSAFLVCTGLSSVDIPSSVTSIGDLAFADCTSLSSISVGMTTPIAIPDLVFYGVNKSTCTLYVPTGCKTAYQNAAIWRDFEHIEERVSSVLATGPCGDNLTYTIYDDMSMVITGTGPMWDYSYDAQINSDYMGSIKSVTIEEGCTTIGSYAFSCFSGLTSVDIPSSVTSIGDFAFFDCEGLTSVDIPNSVTSIGEYAFYFCTGLTSITIPNSVTSIDRCAFQGCTGLTTVTIPSSVSSIDATSFSDLTSIYVDESNATYDSRENCNAIIETSTNTLIAGCKNTVIPNSVTSIGGNAFAGCTGLTSIDIPNSVTYIGGAAFQYCTGLTSVDIPSSVTYIGYTAFSGCTSLSSISVGMTTPISIFNDAFYDVNKSTCTLYVPAGSKTAYENALYWSEFENIVEYGEEPDTDISKYDNIVYIEGTEAVVGQRVRLSLKMNNIIAPTGFQCDVYLPDGVTAAQDEDGSYLMDISTERTTSEKTNVSDCVLQSDGSLRFMCSSTNSYTFSGYEGEVAYLMVDIDPNLEEGTYPLILKNVRISDANAVKYTVDYVKTTLQISTYTVGDANNDGDVDVADFTAIANYILSRPSVSFVEKAADVNADNEIDVADLTGVANLILYGSVSPNASHAKARNDAAAKYVSIEANNVTATKDEEFIVAVTIDGNYAYSGYQFDVTLPEGMTVKDVFGQTTASDVFMSGMIDDNTLRVLCASITGETAESTVVNLTLMADSEGTYSIDIDNAIVSVNASSCAMRNSSFLVAIENEVTGISTLFDEASSNASVYDLTGKKLKSNGNTSSLPKGIYIINGKKVSK